MQWNEEDLNRQRVEKMMAEVALGDGVLVFDDTGFPKQGKASVGVARQYSGTQGNVGYCQVAVTRCYADPQESWPVEVRLYLPQQWTDDPELWRCAHRARVFSVGRCPNPEYWQNNDGQVYWRYGTGWRADDREH
jgi:DDE superfamily endonuclease